MTVEEILNQPTISISNFVSCIVASNCCSTRSEVFRLIKQGAIYIQGHKLPPDIDGLVIFGPTIIKVGKRRYFSRH